MKLQKPDEMEKTFHRKNSVINKKLTYTVCTIALVAIITFGLYEWLVNGRVRPDAFFAASIVLAYLFNYIANGETDIRDEDEREAYLSKRAAGISYFILVISIGGILFVTEGTGLFTELENIPLVIAFSISIVMYPLVRAIIFIKNR